MTGRARQPYKKKAGANPGYSKAKKVELESNSPLTRKAIATAVSLVKFKISPSDVFLCVQVNKQEKQRFLQGN